MFQQEPISFGEHKSDMQKFHVIQYKLYGPGRLLVWHDQPFMYLLKYKRVW